MITVASRERPSTTDPFELSHRNADTAVLEHRAKRLRLPHDAWGELGARRISINARGPRQTGTLLRFLVEAHLCHQSSVLHVEVDDETERQLVLGLGLPEYVFKEGLH